MREMTSYRQARSQNENFVTVDTDNGLVILANGRGSYSAGETASSMTVTLLLH